MKVKPRERDVRKRKEQQRHAAVPLRRPLDAELKRDEVLVVDTDISMERQTKVWLIVGVVALFMLIALVYELRRGREVSPERMAEAAAEARRTWPFFVEAFGSDNPAYNYFCVKVPFEDEGEVKQVWIKEIDVRDGVVSGRVEQGGPGYRVFRGRVDVPEDAITDWMILEGDVLLGGFSTRAYFETMVPVSYRGAWQQEQGFRIVPGRVLPQAERRDSEDAGEGQDD